MDLKVISLNIWRGAVYDNAVAFLKSENADIVGLQEVTNSTGPLHGTELRLYSQLQRELGYTYSSFTPMLINNRTEGRIPEGLAVFSNYPIEETSPVFFEPFQDNYVDIPENFPTSSRCMQHIMLTTPQGKLHVYNMHGVWDLDGDNYSPGRQKMGNMICDEVTGKSPVILLGDTNAKPTNQAIIDIERHLTSVFGNTITSTFNMRRKENPGYATAAVDMMFVSPDITVIDKKVPDTDVSDHLPLVVTVRL